MTAAAQLDLSAEAAGVLRKLSPALLEVAAKYDTPSANPALDAELDGIDADEAALQHLEDASLAHRLEEDFAAYGVPLIDGIAPPLEAWAIPLLSAFAGPGAFFVSTGLTIACKLAVLALDRWKAKHDAAKGSA